MHYFYMTFILWCQLCQKKKKKTLRLATSQKQQLVWLPWRSICSPKYVVLPPGAALMSNTDSPSWGDSAITGRNDDAPCSMYWPAKYSGVAPVWKRELQLTLTITSKSRAKKKCYFEMTLEPTYGNRRVIDNQPRFGPFPQWIQVYSSVNQSLC